MSSTNRNKTKITQDELRRFMSEKKRNILPPSTKKIDSPFAKYNEDGRLACTLCNTAVHSEKLWKVHVNGKQHRERIVLQSQPLIRSAPPKRHFPPEGTPQSPPKKIKSILKNAPKPALPEGFFDSDKSKPSIVPPSENEKSTAQNDTPMEVDAAARAGGDENGNSDCEVDDDKQKASSDIPEGFFDDPKMDAKARNIEYKDPIQEEWDRFQKEMKEENTVSAQIIEDDQEEAIAERQIDEIDEQLRNWSRVLDLELKKEKVQSEPAKNTEETDKEESSEEEGDFDEFLDWRAKRSFR